MVTHWSEEENTALNNTCAEQYEAGTAAYKSRPGEYWVSTRHGLDLYAVLQYILESTVKQRRSKK